MPGPSPAPGFLPARPEQREAAEGIAPAPATASIAARGFDPLRLAPRGKTQITQREEEREIFFFFLGAVQRDQLAR